MAVDGKDGKLWVEGGQIWKSRKQVLDVGWGCEEVSLELNVGSPSFDATWKIKALLLVQVGSIMIVITAVQDWRRPRGCRRLEMKLYHFTLYEQSTPRDALSYAVLENVQSSFDVRKAKK
jgi:hypothetical protein